MKGSNNMKHTSKLAWLLICVMLVGIFACGVSAAAEAPATANGELLDAALIMVKGAQNKAEGIPRFRLHQAARLLAAQDPAFRVRLAMLEIDRHDVERMIQLATYGLIKPQLSDDWLSSPFVLR